MSKSEKARVTLLWGRLQGTVSKCEKAGAADEPGVAVFHTSRVSLCGLACVEGICLEQNIQCWVGIAKLTEADATTSASTAMHAEGKVRPREC